MQILYVPLDERPCNYAYPLRAVKTVNGVRVVSPAADILPHKKTPADTDALWQFVAAHVAASDIAILSTEMLMYGGLIPSRLHHKAEAEIDTFIDRVAALKQQNPRLVVYLSSMIMRTPQYSSAEEEPDYYEEYGRRIFQYGAFTDLTQRGTISESEQAEFTKIKAEVPVEIIEDFTTRRKFNKQVTQRLIKLVKAGAIDFMVIPQDDSHELGFTAMDQKDIYPMVRNLNLSDQILIYPGADEVGYDLLARAVNRSRFAQPKIYVEFTSINGPFIVPGYEDRELGESLKSHVLVTGSRLTTDINQADFVLAYNTAGKRMGEAAYQFNAHEISYDRNRNLPYFVAAIQALASEGKRIAVCDAAYSNGADFQLFQLLAKDPTMMSHLLSYRGWNTNCNTLGSTLSEAIFALDCEDKAHRENLYSEVLDDVFYQAIIRDEIQQIEKNEPNKALGINYFNLYDKQPALTARMVAELRDLTQEYLPTVFIDGQFDIELSFPWNRLFELYCNVTFAH
ncbi:DUF4127 family protein [Lacticaseibacillus suihuaensis]